MALGSYEIELIIQLKRKGYLDGKPSVAEIGTQQLSDGFLEARDQVEEAGRLFRASAPCPLPARGGAAIANQGLKHLEQSAPYARAFWTWLGFDYTAIDIDGSGDIQLDLNYESVAPELAGNYQLVTNFGTTEHVANQLNAFKVIHDLVAPGGLKHHHLPMQGMTNHGLINYNPKFFWMLARSNQYRTIHMSVTTDENYYSLPQDIIDTIAAYDPNFVRRSDTYRIANASLIVVLQKAGDRPYVAPIDVLNGVSTNDVALAERYMSIFEPDKFARLMHFEAVLDRVSGWRLQRELLRRYRRRITHWLG